MKPIKTFVELMSADELAKFRDCAEKLLGEPGMKIGSGVMRAALARKGAVVDEVTQNVRFPKELIDETLQQAITEEKARRWQCGSDVSEAEGTITFSWHTPFMTTSPPMQVSLGGGCPLYYEHSEKKVRYASEPDLVRMLHLSEGIPEIVTCGNAVHCVLDKDGNEVPAELMPLLGAAAIAKNSSKPGSSALMSPWQLDYLVAMGEVVRDGEQGYRAHPVFININDPVPPLELSRPEGEIIEALAARGLPVYILPMPLMGITAPVTIFSAAVIGAAEILGVWAGAKTINPDTPLECSVISGALEPRTGNPSFSAPEAIGVDLAISQFFRHLGLRCGTGVGFIDAPVPGVAAVYERTLKTTISALCGESTFPAGILAAGKIFSPEQLMLDLDINAGYNHFLDGFDGADLDEALGLIREKGIGGMFLDTAHTASNFRQRIWIPKVFSRLKSAELKDVVEPVEAAYQRWQQILSETEPYHLPDDKAREIDRILAKAKTALSERESIV